MLWAVRAGPSAVFWLVRNGSMAPRDRDRLDAGKTLRFSGGGGSGAHDVTRAALSSSAMYVITEPNNLARRRNPTRGTAARPARPGPGGRVWAMVGAMSAIVSYTLTGKTAVVTMDDGKANALSMPMLDELDGALTRAEAEASAVVLTGRPERFSAGFDLRVMMSSPDAAIALLRRGAELLLRLFGLPIPLVIAATGHALAGGALVVLTGDVRLGVDGPYKLGLNEVAIGMPVPLLAMELARARLGPLDLTRATLGAHIYTPAEAVAAGYLDRVTTADALAADALAEGARLGALPRAAYAATKQRLRGAVIELIRAGFEADVARALGK